jgi:hypothetical protein
MSRKIKNAIKGDAFKERKFPKSLSANDQNATFSKKSPPLICQNIYPDRKKKWDIHPKVAFN